MIKEKAIRLAYLATGHVFVLVGIVGIFLPLLPTVPFLLLAALCYERGSPRLHRWLLGHKYLGPPIVMWKRTGAIAPRAKAIAVACIVIGISLSMYRVQNIWLDFMLAGIGIGAGLFILTRPNR